MADLNIDDFDPMPRVSIRVAQTPEENRTALQALTMHRMTQGGGWNDMGNDDFITLCEEPDMLADMTPLERELLARFVAAWKMVPKH